MPSPAPPRRPPSPRAHRLGGHIGRGTLLSLLLHAAAIGPIVAIALVLGARQQAEREEEEKSSVDVSWEDVDPASLPEDLPPIDPEKKLAKPAKPRDPIAKAEPPPPAAKPEPEDPKKEPPPPEEKPPEPPPPEVQRMHEKMVDLDNGKDDKPPPDAKYLAQKNNRAEVETRARDTNLERESKGETPGSLPSERQDEQEGGPEARIAQLDEVKSKLGREAPKLTPKNDPALTPQPDSKDPRRSVLAMREAIPEPHRITPETIDPSLPRDPNGLASLPMDGLRSVRPTPAQSGAAANPRLRLSGNELDYLFGKQIDADRQLAEKRRSQKQGKFTRHLGRVASALENFVPEVQPGNQTALNTRAAPFAAYLAGMHRTIHELWGFGFLTDLDGKPHGDPMNNRDLWTRLEIVLAGDGTIDNVKVIRSSGLTTFDVAAVDVIYSAGPYPDPPPVIKSANGKIYLHWSFHRDERQCATFGADYFILDNPAAGADHASGGMNRGLPGSPPPQKPRKLESLSRDGAHRHSHAGGDELPRPVLPEPDPTQARTVERERPRADDPLARRVAEEFFAAFSAGRAADMVKLAGFPFHAQGGIAARTAGELTSQFQSLIEEAGGARRIHSLNLHSPAGLRAAIGWSPPGLATDPRMLFAVALVGGDTVLAALSPHMGAFRVTALLRR